MIYSIQNYSCLLSVSIFVILFFQAILFFPTFLIAGNHSDFLQTNSSRPCALSAILSGRKPSNFFYLQKTGAYRFHNLIFYVKSLTDNETSTTEFNIPMLISKIKTEVNDSHCLTHIGLYHGSIAGWRNSIGFVSNTGDSTLESF